MISVLLVDDQALIRGGLRALIEAEDDLCVVGEAADGAEGYELAVALRPDVALVDVQMPVQDGIETTRRIVGDERLVDVHVVILTNYGLEEHVMAALRAGAAGFMVKDSDPADLLHGVRTAARGDALLSPSITRRLIESYLTLPDRTWQPEELDLLTPREREVVGLVARGLSNGEIGEVLVISPTTAKTHVSRAMTKLNARDRAQLVVIAYEAGLVTPSRPSPPRPPPRRQQRGGGPPG